MKSVAKPTEPLDPQEAGETSTDANVDHNFLLLISQEMLIVKSPNPNERGRVGIEQVNGKVFNMLLKYGGNTIYTSSPAPWPKRRGDYKNIEEAVETNVAKVPREILRWKMIRQLLTSNLTFVVLQHEHQFQPSGMACYHFSPSEFESAEYLNHEA